MKKTKKAVRKTTKKATAAKKQATLENLSFADGELEVDKVRELEALLGADQMTVFGTNSIEVFKANIEQMSLSDLQRTAAEAGVFPGVNKMALKNRLTKEFVSQTKGRRFAMGEQKPIIDPQNPKFDEVKKLMSEGF